MKRILAFVLILMMVICGATAESAVSGEYSYVVLSDGTAEITAYTGSAQALTLPDAVDGYTVTSIAQGAFSKNTSIESLTVPGNIKRIGKEAFYGCSSLRELTLEEGVTEIMWVAFSKCALSEVTLPESLETLGSFAFSDNSSLTKVVIPASVTKLTDNPFSYCDLLTEVIVAEENPVLSLEDGVLFLTQIGNEPDAAPVKTLLCYPGGLTAESYTTPADVQVIGDRSVTNKHLTYFEISEGAVALDNTPFYNCDLLRDIIVPSSMEKIIDTFFKYCENCRAVVPYGSIAHQFCLDNGIPHVTK